MDLITDMDFCWCITLILLKSFTSLVHYGVLDYGMSVVAFVNHKYLMDDNVLVTFWGINHNTFHELPVHLVDKTILKCICTSHSYLQESYKHGSILKSVK